jgi:hypothetical protein
MSSFVTLGASRYFGLFGAPAPTPPAAMTSARAAVRAAHPAPADPKARDLGWTAGYHILAGGRRFVLEHHAQSVRDAGRSVPVATNADLWLVRHAYGTRRPQEVWISNPPADGILRFNVIMTPSWHVGSDSATRAANANKYAKENVYVVEVLLRAPDGTETSIQAVEFGAGRRKPEYASMSPELQIDLKQLKGEIVIRAAPKGVRVRGYQEARETIIHNS